MDNYIKKIFILVPDNRPSGGMKVANQIINLFKNKGFEAFLVITDDQPQPASFMDSPAPTIDASYFEKNCGPDDIAITFWQNKHIYELFKKCPAKEKIFWQHGIIIPKYKDLNGEEYFRPGLFTQYWNVSSACADYIKNKYKLAEIKIVNPFFDDETLLEYSSQKEINKREGVLILRRRGQEAIPDIINLLSGQKITILPKVFSDGEFYEQLIKHKFFISTDNGVNGVPLLKNKMHRYLKQIKQFLKKLFKDSGAGQIGWVKPEKNLLGFPMSACEAAWLGTNVIAFAMGGGLEWMTAENIYLAKDNNPDSLFDKIKEALEDNDNNLAKKRELALKSVQKFNQENTWHELAENLSL